MADLDLNAVVDHVNDADYFHLPEFLGTHLPANNLPEICVPILGNVQITKYMVIEVAVLLLMIAVFFPMAMKLKGGKRLKGRFWNMMEVFLLYLRDEVIRPSIGSKEEADRFLPYLWTMFFFVLFCNLAGMLPWCGSPTGSFAVTSVLALTTFAVVLGTGMKIHGISGYWIGLVPHMDLPFVLAIVLKPMLFVIELVGLLLKHIVLSIRLLANMFAGHTVLAVFLAFIPMTAGTLFWYPVTAGSVFMSVGISMLELFVAFLQAYIFMFLSALYIGSSVHQH